MGISIRINDFDYTTLGGNTVMQAALTIGIDVPRFCYHEKLSIAGNCRMCLLEVAYPRSLKPVASCALPVVSSMVLYTNTVMVKKSREGVLEFLLLNHPLDCPVCDQGGECDLQDQVQQYGGDRNRFYEAKRAVEDKECGPLIKTSMNRCIHCTKCVRFSVEICGEYSLGTLGRGSFMEIGTFVTNAIDSELSGNLVDICPVGALTSKPYSFRARPWELRSFETVDILDSFGSRIRIDIRGTEVMRVLPSRSEEINEDWITDRTRFSYDGLRAQRLYAPLVRLDGNLVPVSWDSAFLVTAIFLDSFAPKLSQIKPHNYLSIYVGPKAPIVGLFGDLVDAETLVVLQVFFAEIGDLVGPYFIFSQKEHILLDLDFRSSYLLNISFDLLEKVDLFILIGLNPRLELPLLNLRLRKAFLHSNSTVISFGFLTSLTFQCFQQGNNINSVFKFLFGRNYASKCLISSRFPVVLMGLGYSKNFVHNILSSYFLDLKKFSNLITETGWFGLSIVDSSISSQAARDLGLQYVGFDSHVFLRNSFLYLCGVENLDFFETDDDGCDFFNFKVFHGHSGDRMAFSADVVFPGCTFIEKESLYMNLTGTIQKTKFIFNPPHLARTDWKIVSGFRLFFYEWVINRYAGFDKKTLNFAVMLFSTLPKLETVSEVRLQLLSSSPSFKIIDFLNYYPSHLSIDFFVNPIRFRSLIYAYNVVFISNTKNFFLNNAITQISKIMGICAGRFSLRQVNFLKQ